METVAYIVICVLLTFAPALCFFLGLTSAAMARRYEYNKEHAVSERKKAEANTDPGGADQEDTPAPAP